MKFSNVRLLVKDFAKCFKFYSEQLGLEPAWGDENSGYAYFKVADGIEGFALFVSDWMAPSVGNADKELRRSRVFVHCASHRQNAFFVVQVVAIKAVGSKFAHDV